MAWTPMDPYGLDPIWTPMAWTPMGLYGFDSYGPYDTVRGPRAGVMCICCNAKPLEPNREYGLVDLGTAPVPHAL
eukprot:7869490-Lingulodinium_polyedra.AAC.1